MLNPIFVVPFMVVLGRTLFLSIVLLLVFAAARAWPNAWLLRWLPEGLGPVIAVATAAPVATLLVYLIATGGDFIAFVQTPGRVSGFMWIAGSGLSPAS